MAEKSKLKKAHKKLKFWFKVLLGTELMDDPKHRKEFMDALQVIKSAAKKEVV